MNNIQNKKIVQVTDETEIVGVDVGMIAIGRGRSPEQRV